MLAILIDLAKLWPSDGAIRYSFPPMLAQSAQPTVPYKCLHHRCLFVVLLIIILVQHSGNYAVFASLTNILKLPLSGTNVRKSVRQRWHNPSSLPCPISVETAGGICRPAHPCNSWSQHCTSTTICSDEALLGKLPNCGCLCDFR